MPKPTPSVSDRSGSVQQTLERAADALRMGRAADAEQLACAVLKSNWGNVPAARLLGHALAAQTPRLDGLEPLKRAARRSQDSEAETLLARALAACGREDEAFEQYRLATTRRPAFVLAFMELGWGLVAAGRAADGVAVFNQGIEAAPDAGFLRIGLGHVLLNQGDRKAARGAFADALAANPKSDGALAGLARIAMQEGDFKAAVDLFERALALRPHDSPSQLALGKCLLELDRRQEGEAALRLAAQGAAEYAGLAVAALAAAPHGRVFLRPSEAERFLAVTLPRP